MKLSFSMLMAICLKCDVASHLIDSASNLLASE